MTAVEEMSALLLRQWSEKRLHLELKTAGSRGRLHPTVPFPEMAGGNHVINQSALEITMEALRAF